MGRIEEHNREVRLQARSRAEEMQIFPSKLEERMMAFLKAHHVVYECQKIFYIYAEDRWIVRYYIADFYIPKKNIIIEVDGKFHNKQKQHDKNRTKLIQEQYPDIEVLRYGWHDFDNRNKMRDLLCRIS